MVTSHLAQREVVTRAGGPSGYSLVIENARWKLHMTYRISVLGPDGNQICVVAAGDGPPLFLLHGFPLDHRLWVHQLEGLSSRHHVIAPEFRGFGDSSLHERSFSLADLADDIEFVRRHLTPDQPIVLCGLSMGGYVALEYWSRYAANLRGLILANTKPDADEPGARQARLAMAETVEETGTKAAVEGMLSKLLSAGSQANESLRQRVESMMYSVQPVTIQAAQQAMANRRDFQGQLQGIRVPTLILTGVDDPIAPPEPTRRWADLISNAEVRVIKNSGHLSPIESNADFNESVARFLDGLS